MFNRKVVGFKTGINSDDNELVLMSEGIALHNYRQAQAVKENHSIIESRVQEKEKHEKQQNLLGKVYEREVQEAQIPIIMNRISQEGKLVVFKDIISEMFIKSLLLDQNHVIAHESALRDFASSYVDERGGYALLENAYEKTKSPLLKRIMMVCERTAAEVTKRKYQDVSSGQISNDDIRFELNSEEQEKLDLAKQDLTVDQISDLVKQKVLTVVKDENERQRHEEQLYQDLEDQANEEGVTVEEVMKRVIIDKLPVEEGTLFNTIFRTCFKEYVSESTAIASGHQLDHLRGDDAEDINVNADSDDAAVDRFNDSEDNSENENEGRDVELLDDSEMSIDMDLILAEAITQYTIIEMAYTIQLEDHTYDSIQSMSRKMLN